MICLPLALSLTNSITKIGAIAAFAALLGIAVLALLVFAQAREIKRLREWAGRAPERAAEYEQRVSNQAAARVAGVQPVPGARPIPRATPLNVRAQAASGPASKVVPGAPVPAGAPPTGTAPAAQGTQSPGTPALAEQQKAGTTAGTNAPAPTGGAAPEARTTGTPPGTAATTPVPATAGPQPPAKAGEAQATADVPASSNGPAPEQTGDGASASSADGEQQTATPTPAPATAAAKAARSPFPPAPAAAQSPQPAVPASVGETPRSAGATRPTADVAAASRTADQPSSAGPATQRRGPQTSPSQGSYKFLTDEVHRSSARTVIIALGVLLAVAVIAVVAINALSEGGSSPGPSTLTQTGTASTQRQSHTHHGATAGLSDPATMSVSVLNGTETNDLAHHLAASLSEKGYTKATPLDGHPPGTYPKTLVEYSSGHNADALNIAKLLELPSSQVKPIQATTQQLVNGASVAIIAGVDEATKFSSTSQTGAVPSTGSSGGESGANVTGG